MISASYMYYIISCFNKLFSYEDILLKQLIITYDLLQTYIFERNIDCLKLLMPFYDRTATVWVYQNMHIYIYVYMLYLYVINVIIKFVDQHIIEFFSCFFVHTSTRGILQRYVYIYIHIHSVLHYLSTVDFII